MKQFINKITCADSLEIMKQLPDKCINLVLTDPPYGIGISGQKKSISKNPKHNRKEHEDLGWDSSIPSQEYFDEMIRISKNQIIWGGNYFLPHLKEGHKGWIFWDKGQRGLTMSDGELAYTSFDTALRAITFNRCEIARDCPAGSFHPTQKPIELMRWCLENYSKEGDLVLDCFGGSGTTARACKDMNRDFILIEKEQKYCDIAEKRLDQEVLF